MILRKKILSEHCKKYPMMQPQDLYKLLYQAEFGPNHFNVDMEKSFESITNELLDVRNETSFVEKIGNHFVRFYFYKNMNCKYLNNVFIKSCKKHYGSFKQFKRLLYKASNLIPSLDFSFSKELFDAFTKEMELNNFPDVHHSEIYRKRYTPHYRVVKISKVGKII